MEIILQLRMLTVVIDGLDIIFRIADFLLLRITLQHRWSNQCAGSTLIIYRIDLINDMFFSWGFTLQVCRYFRCKYGHPIAQFAYIYSKWTILPGYALCHGMQTHSDRSSSGASVVKASDINIVIPTIEHAILLT